MDRGPTVAGKGLLSVEWMAQSSRRTEDRVGMASFHWEGGSSTSPGCERSTHGPSSPTAREDASFYHWAKHEPEAQARLPTTGQDPPTECPQRGPTRGNNKGSEHTLPGTAPGCERRPASEKQRTDPRRNCEGSISRKCSWPQTEEDPEGARSKFSTAGQPASEKPRGDQRRRTCEVNNGKRPWPQTDEEDPEGARPRTKFSTEQLQELERSFQEQRYIGVAEKRRLARELNLSELRIKTWFQNRRMKFKRQNQDARVEALFSGLILPYASYQEALTPDCIARNNFSVPTSPCSTPVSGLPNVPLQSAHGPSGFQPISIPALGLCSYPATMLPLPFPGEYSSPRFHPYFPS